MGPISRKKWKRRGVKQGEKELCRMGITCSEEAVLFAVMRCWVACEV